MLLPSLARPALALAAAALLASAPLSAQANRVESPSQFSGDQTTIAFEGLNPGSLVAEQFAGQGVHLSLAGGGAPFAEDANNKTNEFRSTAGGTGHIQNFAPGAPVPGGMEDFPDLIVNFDTLVNRVGFAITSNEQDNLLLTISCMCLGEVVATEFFDVGLGWRYAGLETEIPFDQVLVNVELAINAAFRLDDLAFENDPTVQVNDTIIPDVVITSPADGALLNSSSVVLSADVADQGVTTVTSNPAGISGTVPAGGGSISGIVALVEGLNRLSVSATDPAGNVGGTSVSVRLDSTAPSVSVSPGEGAVVATSPVTLDIAVTDATATTVTVDGTTLNFPAGGGTGSAQVALTEGANAIQVTAVDALGNTSAQVRTIVLDTNAPVITIDDPANRACFGPTGGAVPVTVTVNDLTEVTVHSVPAGVAGSLPAGGGTLSGAVSLPEGDSILTLFATDSGGNVSQTSVFLTLDTTPPTAQVLTPVNGDAIRGQIDFSGQASDGSQGSGLARVDFLVDGGVVGTFAGGTLRLEFDTTTLADGAHTFSVLAADNKGLETLSDSVAIVDNTAPSVQLDDLLAGDLVSGSTSFQATATDDTSGIITLRMLVAGGPPTTDGSVTDAGGVPVVTGTSFEDTTVRLDGTLVFSASATDAAGNTSTASVVVEVDNTAPEKTLVTPSHGQSVAGVMDIIAEADDPNLATLEILVGGSSLGTSFSSPFATTFDTRTLLDGPLAVTVVATDLAGNLATCTAEVTVSNQQVEIAPRTLNLGSSGKELSVTGLVEGPSTALLLPAASHSILLRIPGGSSVRATAGFSGGDVLGDADLDGVPDVTIKFDRQAVIASIQAGIDAGLIVPGTLLTVTIVVDGRALGSDRIRVKQK